MTELLGVISLLAAGALFAGPMAWGRVQSDKTVVAVYVLLSIGISAIVL